MNHTVKFKGYVDESMVKNFIAAYVVIANG